MSEAAHYILKQKILYVSVGNTFYLGRAFLLTNIVYICNAFIKKNTNNYRHFLVSKEPQSNFLCTNSFLQLQTFKTNTKEPSNYIHFPSEITHNSVRWNDRTNFELTSLSYLYMYDFSSSLYTAVARLRISFWSIALFREKFYDVAMLQFRITHFICIHVAQKP